MPKEAGIHEQNQEDEGRPEDSGGQWTTEAGRRRKQEAILTGLLQRPDGATLAEVMKATGWQAHSCHGAISTLGGKSVAGADGELRYKL